MPHCIICNSRNECTLLRGRFFCAECSNDLSALTINPKKFDAMMEYLRLARGKNERELEESQFNGGLTQIDRALLETMRRRQADNDKS